MELIHTSRQLEPRADTPFCILRPSLDGVVRSCSSGASILWPDLAQSALAQTWLHRVRITGARRDRRV